MRNLEDQPSIKPKTDKHTNPIKSHAKQIAVETGVPYPTIMRWVSQGYIPGIKKGGWTHPWSEVAVARVHQLKVIRDLGLDIGTVVYCENVLPGLMERLCIGYANNREQNDKHEPNR